MQARESVCDGAGGHKKHTLRKDIGDGVSILEIVFVTVRKDVGTAFQDVGQYDTEVSWAAVGHGDYPNGCAICLVRAAE